MPLSTGMKAAMLAGGEAYIADGGNWHGYCVAGGSPLTLEMPTDCTFISVVALGSGTMYAYQA